MPDNDEVGDCDCGLLAAFLDHLRFVSPNNYKKERVIRLRDQPMCSTLGGTYFYGHCIGEIETVTITDCLGTIGPF